MNQQNGRPHSIAASSPHRVAATGLRPLHVGHLDTVAGSSQLRGQPQKQGNDRLEGSRVHDPHLEFISFRDIFSLFYDESVSIDYKLSAR